MARRPPGVIGGTHLAERAPMLTLTTHEDGTGLEMDAGEAGGAGPTGSERRAHRRFGLSRPSKVFRRSTQTFIPAMTRNLSRTGALVELSAARPMRIGEIVDIGVAYRRDALVLKERLVQAIVVRVDALDEARQAVALRYLVAGDDADEAGVGGVGGGSGTARAAA